MKRLFELLLISFFCFSCGHDLEEINHEYVDLGLSVKWATCNLGASKPEDYGNYYAWGETKHKKEYSAETYKWCVASDDVCRFTKYCPNEPKESQYFQCELIDNKTTLELADDAAHVNWGDNWRIPTAEEMAELVRDCIWEWTLYNGKTGFKVTSKKNSNYIFLPAAGKYSSEGSEKVGITAWYWTSELFILKDHPLYGDVNYFTSANTLEAYEPCSLNDGAESRFDGLTICPVCP